jgi:hypothetical protein
VNSECAGGVVTAEIVVANVGVGHLLPTGPAGKRLVLEVTASGPDGLPLRAWTARQVSGGKEFTLGSQLAASVTRTPPLAPFATDVSEYRFSAPAGGPAKVTARLVLVPVNGASVEISSASSFCRNPGGTP